MIDMKTVSNLSHNPLVLTLVLLAGLIYLDDDKEVARRMSSMEAQIQVLNTQVQATLELVKENGQQIRALGEKIEENSQQIAILSERITRLHPELSAKR